MAFQLRNGKGSRVKGESKPLFIFIFFAVQLFSVRSSLLLQPRKTARGLQPLQCLLVIIPLGLRYPDGETRFSLSVGSPDNAGEMSNRKTVFTTGKSRRWLTGCNCHSRLAAAEEPEELRTHSSHTLSFNFQSGTGSPPPLPSLPKKTHGGQNRLTWH